MTGVILCGGQSKRMGQSKSLMPWRGTTMLGHIVDVVKTRCNPVIVVAAEGDDLPQLPSDVLVLNDDVEYQGPLRGMLKAIHSITTDSFFLCSCDVPNISSQFIDELAQAFTEDHNAVIPEINDQLYPVTGIYRTRIQPVVEEMIAMSNLRFTNLFHSIRYRKRSESDFSMAVQKAKPWQGFNTPDEYASLVAKS